MRAGFLGKYLSFTLSIKKDLISKLKKCSKNSRKIPKLKEFLKNSTKFEQKTQGTGGFNNRYPREKRPKKSLPYTFLPQICRLHRQTVYLLMIDYECTSLTDSISSFKN